MYKLTHTLTFQKGVTAWIVVEQEDFFFSGCSGTSQRTERWVVNFNFDNIPRGKNRAKYKFVGANVFPLILPSEEWKSDQLFREAQKKTSSPPYFMPERPSEMMKMIVSSSIITLSYDRQARVSYSIYLCVQNFLFCSLSHNNPVNIGNGNRSRQRAPARGRVGSLEEWPAGGRTFDRVGLEKKPRTFPPLPVKTRKREKFSLFDSFINFATWRDIHL